MRILWLKSDLLVPLDKGGKLRTWHLMRHLARRHEIAYLSFRVEEDREAVDAMRQVAAHLETVPRHEPAKRSAGFYLDAAMHLCDPLPYAVAKYRSRAYRRAIRALIDRRPFDVVVCDFLVPAVNLPQALPCPAVLFTHNVEAEIWRRHGETARGPVARLLFRAQHRRMRRFEERTLSRFDGVLAVSDADRDTFVRLYPSIDATRIRVVPTGVDTTYFTPTTGAPRPSRLVFTGSMDWLPNEDAMVHFCRDVLPLIQRERPDVSLAIVGRAPTPAVAALAAGAGVEVTGRVDDVRPFVDEAAVYVVPLRIAGGTRLKIFEAMAMGKAIVSTTVGAEGLPVTGGEHLIVADAPDHFAAAVLGLLGDGERRRQLGAAARALVLARYDWSVAADVLEDALLRIASARPAEAPTGATPLSTIGIQS